MLLVIETAFAALSVALLDGERIVADEHRLVGRGHAETLMPTVATVVGDGGAGITAVLVDIGPGSFTGLRVGIAAARALGLAWGVPVRGVGSLTLIAAPMFAADAGLTDLAVVVDAGRGQVYWQRFAYGCVPCAPPAGIAADAVYLPSGIAVAGEVPRAADARFVPPPLRSRSPLPLYLRALDAVAA